MTPDAASVAATMGVVDALVFRRIGTATWAHLGGLGRGRGWAGFIDVDESADPLAFRIPRQVGEVCRERFTEPSRMIGPYYASSGAVIRISNDVAVVFGNPTGPLADADDAELLRLAYLVDAEIDEVHPSKRLADELEVLSTVRELMDAPVDCGLLETLRHITAVAIKSLACEIGVLRDQRGSVAIAGDTDLTAPQWGAIIDEIAGQMRSDLYLAQDLTTVPSPRLTRTVPQARSVMVIAPPPPVGGHLMVLHTSVNPRGFSSQCQRLCRSIAETGTVMARTALLRDELRLAADRASAAARTDPLTGLGNRLAWDEAIAHAQEQVDAGRSYSVITIDVDGLKDINDRYGHNAGDELLRHCADIIRDHCGPGDLAVRMGGDEFTVLVPKKLGPSSPTYVAFMARLSGLRSTRDQVAASVGVSTAPPGGSLFDAVREADMQMYANKRERRRQVRLQRA